MHPCRNSQKRHYQENSIYFITTKTFESFPYFKEPIFCEFLVEELRICKILKKFKLYTFCLSYDHLHLLIQPRDKFNISKIMQFLKRHISRNINFILDFRPVGDIGQCRLQKENNKRYEHIIHCCDQKLKQFKNQFIQKYGKTQIVISKFKWQKSFHDHIIRNEEDFESHYDYTIYNFQKHNLPEDWKYTSLNYEELIDGIVL